MSSASAKAFRIHTYTPWHFGYCNFWLNHLKVTIGTLIGKDLQLWLAGSARPAQAQTPHTRIEICQHKVVSPTNRKQIFQ